MAQISVIIPVYNCEKYIEECIKSVLKQSYKDFELILVDDGSTDSSGQICEAYALKDKRIFVIHKENGGGAGEARNVGLSNASCPFVFFIDSDDWVEPSLFEKMMKKQDEGNYDIVICGYKNIIDKNNDKINERIIYPEHAYVSEDEVKKFFVSKYPEGMVGYPWNKLYKRDIIDRYHLRFPKMRRLEDGIFNMEYFENIKSCYVLNEALCNYRLSQQVEKKKLPLDFYNLMECFVLQYYEKLENWGFSGVENEAPMVFYFLNDLVCCIENIYVNKDEIESDRRKKILQELRKKKLVKYMLNQKCKISKYSQVVLKLFQRSNYKILGIVISIKYFLKMRLNRIFHYVKRRAN